MISPIERYVILKVAQDGDPICDEHYVKSDHSFIPAGGGRTRFAPSPTGYLHLGHIVSALYVWAVAKARGDHIILRIEDHDRGRSRKIFEESILQDLEWFGFQPDDGVASASMPSPYRQSDHIERYEEYFQLLRQQNEGIFPCVCSRKDILSRDPQALLSGELRYDNFCRFRAKDPTWDLQSCCGWRVAMPDQTMGFEDGLLGRIDQNPHVQCGDMLVRDREQNWTYQFAVSVDDYVEGITSIVRGQDLLSTTARQVYLARLLGRPFVPEYLHHPLLTEASGVKLSKSLSSKRAARGRDHGEGPEPALGAALFAARLSVEDRPTSLASALEMVQSDLFNKTHFVAVT